MEILGHTSPAVMPRYQHVVDELKHEAAAATDAILRRGTPSGDPDNDPPEFDVRELR